MNAAYVELAAASNYSFLRGASHPAEMVSRAAELGLAAIGLTDCNSVSGLVRGHVAAREAGIRFLPGARLKPRDGPDILCYPSDRAAWGRLCRLLTLGKRRAAKGECDFSLTELCAHAEGQLLLVLPPPHASDIPCLPRLKNAGVWKLGLAAPLCFDGGDANRLMRLASIATRQSIPMVAVADAWMHAPCRKPLADLMTCVREGVTIDAAGFRLDANAERHLRSADEMLSLYEGYEHAVTRSEEIAAGLRFSLDELRYEYPEEQAPPGYTRQEWLERLTWDSAAERYPRGIPQRVRELVQRELKLIEELDYAPYFLTIHDLVRHAREQGILCQGRGSAANSAVCFCLGITAVDPEKIDLLFERFISSDRGEPPDIDVDFEHERREEVIQYLYRRYGRERAGLTATVIHYRPRSALRETGKALGLPPAMLDTLTGQIWGREGGWPDEARIKALGLDPQHPRLKTVLALAAELVGFPRHLSQHPGGMVMTRGRLDEVAPISNAAMAGRTMLEWDKNDLDDLGMLKVDVLALGMLTCLRKCLDLLACHHDRPLTLADIPAEDPEVYDMLCRADTVGVFQVESRAQMSFLPRMRPRCFYDLVIEVAIVRPGPIQGDMVHPYLRRRHGKEPVEYPSEELRRVLDNTLGVPLFQEQAMRIAVVAAGFSPAQADALRRSMATFRNTGTVKAFREKFVAGMTGRGYSLEFAERCFSQIEGFGEYGFPESHAASFAILVYASAWFKHHYPEVFACALLNSQPMGFYAPAQIVRDAREHGVNVLPVDVNFSEVDCTLTADNGTRPALRLGLRQVRGLGAAAAERLTARREEGYLDIATLCRRTFLDKGALRYLARADAFASMGMTGRRALWEIERLPGGRPLPLFAAGGLDELPAEPSAALPSEAPGERVLRDYDALGLSLKGHPLAFCRAQLETLGYWNAEMMAEASQGDLCAAAGLVLVRQAPHSASGVVFLTLEDETGVVNVVLWPGVFERNRNTLMGSVLLGVQGEVQRENDVVHLVARRLEDLSDLLGDLTPAPIAAPHTARFTPRLSRARQAR
ncbi:error-prone DNA polymerase [Candidatus Foliamicus sp.]